MPSIDKKVTLPSGQEVQIVSLQCPKCGSEECSFQRPVQLGCICHACGHKWTMPGVENLRGIEDYEGPVEDF